MANNNPEDWYDDDWQDEPDDPGWYEEEKEPEPESATQPEMNLPEDWDHATVEGETHKVALENNGLYMIHDFKEKPASMAVPVVLGVSYRSVPLTQRGGFTKVSISPNSSIAKALLKRG